MAVANNLPPDRLRGIAFYDTERDSRFTSLAPFDAARQAVTKIPIFIARFGLGEAGRIVLQFVYEYFARVDDPRFEKAAFEALWVDFTAEIQEANWVYRGVANIRNFTSQFLHLDLDDGIAIRGRNFNELTSLGFGAAVLGQITEDWHGWGASSFVLVSEQTIPKQPENVILMDASSVWIKAIRAIGAMRLLAEGQISIGPMWVIRAARFNAGTGGLSRVGFSLPAMGATYIWTENLGRMYPSLYRELAQLETVGYDKSPGNLEIALRAFMGTYDRWPLGADSQLLDIITALEALLGTETEIAFKLAFRVAGLLAASDNERGVLFKLMKDFYDTRSKLVHGGHLKEKHQQMLRKVDTLRALVRQLLRSFVSFAATPLDGYGKSFFQEHLDVALLNSPEREKLRTALGLNRA